MRGSGRGCRLRRLGLKFLSPRRFSEPSNEIAGEYFTPREVIRLMVNLLFIEDDPLLTPPGIVKTLFDPACGTVGGSS